MWNKTTGVGPFAGLRLSRVIAGLLAMFSAVPAWADFTGYYAIQGAGNVGNWTLSGAGIDPRSNQRVVTLASGVGSSTSLTIAAQHSGTVSARLSFSQHGASGAGYVLNGVQYSVGSSSFTQNVSFSVKAGDIFGFYVGSTAPQNAPPPPNPPGTVAISSFTVSYTIGGTLSGLPAGATVVLQNNGRGDLSLSNNGPFTFAAAIPSGSTYSVSVHANPENYVCTVSNGAGTAADNVSDVAVNCVFTQYTVGGMLTGLPSGGAVVLQDNGGSNLKLTSNGPFTFATALSPGSKYNVSVLSAPGSYVCTPSNSSGTVSANVSNVNVTCAIAQYTVGGTFTESPPGVAVVLVNGADALTLSANGRFTFAKPVSLGQRYDVAVKSAPGTYACTVNNGVGVVTGNVSNVNVSCAPPPATIGGTLSGLPAGASVVLQNNGGDNLSLSSNGPFTFAKPILEGQEYDVTVLTQPANYSCTVSNGASVDFAPHVTNVTVSCVRPLFKIGGTLSGLPAGMSLVVKNNGGDDLTLTANGRFTFSKAILSGLSYSVSVVGAIPGYTCSVVDAAGIAAGNVANISVTCVAFLNAVYSFSPQEGGGGPNYDGYGPHGGLVRDAAGNFYGTTVLGGSNKNGVVFEITGKGAYLNLHTFSASRPASIYPGAPPVLVNSDGCTPWAGLVRDASGNLYGTANGCGPNGNGTVFKISTDGQFSVIYAFSPFQGSYPTQNRDGAGPASGLLLAGDGCLYGTTGSGGASGSGTIFKLSTSGTLTTLYSFPTSRFAPVAGRLIQAPGGVFYAVTLYGGDNGTGSVFSFSPSAGLKTLYSFEPLPPPSNPQNIRTNGNGANPGGGLLLAQDGSLYGTTVYGGPRGGGTLFKISTSGALTTLFSFAPSIAFNSYGSHPDGGLIQSASGEIYGAAGNDGLDGPYSANGTVFKLTQGTWTPITVLCTFPRFTPSPVGTPQTNSSGAYPSGLLLESGGYLYGTAGMGGRGGTGTVFSCKLQ